MRMTTAKGYGFFEATSAFQKAIRRGDEQVALYFMVEFFNAGYDEYLWRRMKVICSEDIGLAEPDMMVRIDALYRAYSDQKIYNQKNIKPGKPNSKGERMFLVHAVVMMVRAKKSRLIDYLLISTWREHDSCGITIPDYAYDVHTQKGKSMGRDVKHFWSDDGGIKINNASLQEGEIEAKKKAYEWIQKIPGRLNFGTIGRQHTMNFEEETESEE